MTGNTVYVAVIEHRYGCNFYVHATAAGRDKAVADYCRTWWEEEWMAGPAPADDALCVEEYFERNPHESCCVAREGEEIKP